MEYPEEAVTYQNNVKKAIYVFIGIMLFLTFFSKTINNLALPRVRIAASQEGTLIKEVRADGIIESKAVYATYVKDPFQVEDIKVQAGETVSKGQILMVLDTKDLERQLSDEQKVLEQKEITLAKLRSESAREMAEAGDDLDIKKRNLAITQQLYETGGESKISLENAQADLRKAERAYIAALNRGSQSVEGPNLEIRNAGLDIELQQSKIARIKEELKIASNVVAPYDGIITGINCTKGSLSDPAKPLYTLTSAQGGFELKVTVESNKADFFKPGEEVEVSVPSSEEEQIKGKIRGIRITPADQSGNNKKEQKDVIIDIEFASLRGGEHAKVYIKRETKRYEVLIPNEAIKKDKGQTYVFILHEKKGALGKEYYIQKVKIFCADSDDSKTAVADGLMWNEKIVCSSDKVLSEGDRVKVGTESNKGNDGGNK